MTNTTRKWLRRAIWTAAGMITAVAVLGVVMLALMWHWLAVPPAFNEKPAITGLVPQNRGERVYLGSNWFGRVEGLPVIYLTGTPFEMGYANGVLTQKLIHRQEQTVLDLFHRVAPFRWTQFVIKFLLVYKNRHMSEHVTLEQQLEMLGLCRGCPDPHPEVGPYYYRILNYHGAQDISYMMMHSALIRRGCTSFGAWGEKTKEGHLLAGRNFDWEADPVFDEDRVVVICEPKTGIPFVSLAWAGMVGCVSGMNRDGVFISVNGAPSRLPSEAATPTCLVAREVLQYAHNIEEATEIIRKRQVFVSAIFLVGSRKDGRFVTIEKTPERLAVREAESKPYIVCANHYMTAGLAEDPVNVEFKAGDTSVPRYDRMNELLASADTLNPERCVGYLRDRQLPGGRFPGSGHRSSINPLIATHAVVADLTDGIFWAAAPPHQLGKFVAFGIGIPGQTFPERAISADPMLGTGEYKHFQAAQAKLVEGWQAQKKGNYRQSEQCARLAETNNPGFYGNAWLLAESLFRQGKQAEASRAVRAAVEGKPALGGERNKIEKLAREIGGAGRK